MKKVRFTQVVERSGQPHVHALWVAPERDPEFVRARKADRVMTVQPRAQGKADVGVVGFDAAHPGGQILIFPKSLKPFDGRQVVGVKFDLVEQPETQNVTAPQDWKPPAKKHGGSHRAPVLQAPAAARQTPHNEEADRSPPASESRRPKHPKPHEHAHARETRKSPPTDVRRKTGSGSTDSALLRQVHAALKELREGKAVAAYERLEKAAAEAEGD